MKIALGLLPLTLLVAAPAWFAPAVPVATRAPQGGWTTGVPYGIPLENKTFGPGVHYIDLGVEGEYHPDLWVVILDYETFTVPEGTKVMFRNHPSYAPVAIRARGDIAINGWISLDGAIGYWEGQSNHSEPGPGGFRGGTRAEATYSTVASAGHGPGGGTLSEGTGIGGSHSTLGANATAGLYGGPFCIPLTGGSGGSGASSSEGGAGGGALLIGSDSRILFGANSRVSAKGGAAGYICGGCTYPFGGPGAGGTVRVAAPEIIDGGAQLDASGGVAWFGLGGTGRLRIESAQPVGQFEATPLPSYGALGDFLPIGYPTVTLEAWFEGDGTRHEIGQDPRGRINHALETDVPLPTTGEHRVRIAGRAVPQGAPLEIRVTNTRGSAQVLNREMGEDGGDGDVLWTDVMINFGEDISTVQVRALLQ